MLGEGPALEQLVDAVNREEAGDVGAQVVGDSDSHSMGGDHLHCRTTMTVTGQPVAATTHTFRSDWAGGLLECCPTHGAIPSFSKTSTGKAFLL